MAARAALSDVSVISLAVDVPGPVAVARLRDLGASITTVLPPHGDPLAAVAPDWFEALRQGQEMLTLDLDDPVDHDELTARLAEACLLVTSQRPQALSRWGLDWDSLHQRYPNLSQIAIAGHPGDAGQNAGHDLTHQAEAGLGEPPHLPTTLAAELMASERAVALAWQALQFTEITGYGCYLEAAVSDMAHQLAAPHRAGLTRSGGVLGGSSPGYRLYACRDGHVALAALEPELVANVCTAFGVHFSADELTAALKTLTCEQALHRARAHDVPMTIWADDTLSEAPAHQLPRCG